MPTNFRTPAVLLLFALVALAGPAAAGEVEKTFGFALDDWQELEVEDSPITLHRFRIDVKEGRLTKAALSRPHNQEYLQTVRMQLEYSNESDRKWKARITARWLDADGTVIDGFSANEGLEKRSAKKITQVSLSTLTYGLEKAETLEVEIHYEP